MRTFDAPSGNLTILYFNILPSQNESQKRAPGLGGAWTLKKTSGTLQEVVSGFGDATAVDIDFEVSHILIVEDEPKVADALREGFEGEAHGVTVARTGEEGFFLLNSQPFDVVILDIMLPGRSGTEILQAIRRQGVRVPVLLLTAKDTVEDRVLGLDLGADDYLVKPFAFAELSARVRALLRRSRSDPSAALKVGDLELDVLTRTVKRAGKQIDLTAREFDVLEYLVRHQGQVVSRDMLARDVWKEPSRPTPLDNVIDVHMVRLRRKVDEGFEMKLVYTVRGIGFTLKAETT